jgi:serine phosphatase RsbU (regulator of sigma subunit)
VVVPAEQQELVSGLRLERVLGRGAHSVVWAASSLEDGAPWARQRSVVVKLALDGSAEHGAMLRREARFLARIQHPHVVRLWQVGSTEDGREYLVLAEAQGGSLADALRKGPLSLERTLGVALGAARALDACHRKGVVHRDVKPSNLLFARDQEVWLSDFGLGHDLVLAELGVGASRVAGSLLYAAPEQTGMLRREIDGRSDLYALGVVLFECLAGRPPFQGDEAEALLTLHASARPPDVRLLRPDTPEALAQLLARLLAKDPDDRPASARLLVAELESLERGESLATSASKQSAGDLEPLFGRDHEVQDIRHAVQALRSGRGGTLCVTGDDGAGKFRVCEAALATLEHVRVLRARAADADGSSFAPFRALLAQLIQLAAQEGGGPVADTLARHGSALARLFPGLPGLPAPREELSADVALEALVRVFGECSSSARPCVILFEAADRLGQTDRGVLRRLHLTAQSAALLVLCTGESKPFLDAEHAVPELHLGPLDPFAVEQLLRHVLGPLPLAPRLSELTLSCSAGNPAALRRLLVHALAEGVLDTDGARWLLDEARLLALESPVASQRSLEAALHRLDAEVLVALRHASLFGRRFEPRWLELVGHPARQVSEALWEGTQRRLLVSSSDGSAMFAHASLCEAFAQQVGPEERAGVLARLLEGLEARPSLDRAERALLARAHFVTVEASTARRAWERCLEAGLSELEAFAFVEARTLLDGAARIAERFAIEPDFRLHRALAQLEAQGGNVEGAVGRFRLAIASCKDSVERANMHVRCAELRFFNESGNIAPMRDHLEQAWGELGQTMPTPGFWSVPLALLYVLLALFVEITGIGRCADGISALARTRVRLCEITGMYFFWTNRLAETLRVCMLGWYLGRRTGPCREVVHGLAGLGNFFRIVNLAERGERYYAEGYRMAEQLGDASAQAYVRYMQGIGASLTRDAIRSERLLAQSVERHAGDLDISYLAQAAANLAAACLYRGDVPRAEQVLARVREQVESRFGEEVPLPESCVAMQLDVFIQTGRVDRAEPLVDRITRRLTDPRQDMLGWHMRLYTQALHQAALGSPDEVVDALIARADISALSPRGSAWIVSRPWVMASHLRLQQWLRATPSERPRRAQLFFESFRMAERVPRGPYVKGHYHVLHAAALWLRGRRAAAERELVRAEQEALTWDAPRVLVEARALRGHMLRDLGRDGPARHEAQAAVALADASGMTARAREIERTFSLARGSASGSEATSRRSLRPLTSSVQRERDALLEVTVAASHELEPSAQAAIVLDRLVALLGAERGLIFADAEDGELVRLAARSAQREDLPADVTYAQSLVKRVRQTSVPLVLSGTEEGAGLGSESMVAGNLRSMVCAPIRLGERTRGVIYLDSSLARGVFTRRDLEIVEAMGSQIALTQEMARGARMQVERLALEKDLQLSGAVQSLFLPKEREVALGELSIAAAYVPVSHSGGDYWFYERRSDGRCWVLVADATGHGAGAAMVTAVLAGSYRSLVDRGASSLAEVLAELHRTMSGVFGGRHAATVTALELSPDSRQVSVWSAGGPPLLVRNARGEVDSHVVRGSPLGTAPWVLGELRLELEPGARLLVVTDGVLEMPTTSGRELGARKLRKMLAEHGGRDVPAARTALMQAIVRERGSLEADDDLTLLVMGRG